LYVFFVSRIFCFSRCNSIYIDALNDFEEEEQQTNNTKRKGNKLDISSATSKSIAAANSNPYSSTTNNRNSNINNPTGDDAMRDAIARMMQDMHDPEFQNALEATIREMGTGAGSNTPGGVNNSRFQDASEDGMASEIFRSLAVESGAQGAEGIAKTLEILQKLSTEADNMGQGGIPGANISSDSANATENLSDEVIKRMMAEFEAMGQKEDFSSVVDNMMRQLLSKDIMYVPMKSICERFPNWLAEHASQQTKEEYENYGRMYQAFQKLVMVYETEPDNFPRLMELMQDLQECGQPPAEIIKDLAPGLELSPDGLPLMPNMGPGMPGIGGSGEGTTPNLPCCIQ